VEVWGKVQKRCGERVAAAASSTATCLQKQKQQQRSLKLQAAKQDGMMHPAGRREGATDNGPRAERNTLIKCNRMRQMRPNRRRVQQVF
jgi:hypothetical protein